MSDWKAGQARREEFNTRLMALVNEFKDVTWPEVDPIDNEVCEHLVGDDCPCAPPENALLVEWCFIAQWQDMEADNAWSATTFPTHMLRSHRIGLLESHLRDM